MSKKGLITVSLLFLLFRCSGEEKREKIRIKIATFNVHHFQNGYTAVYNTVLKINPDILALQEVLVKGRINYSQKLADDMHMFMAVSRPYVIFPHRQWVLSFLSRYPVKRKEETRLGKYRRAIKVTLDIKGRIAAFTTMHLSPFIWDSRNLLTANRKRSRDRIGEVKDLINWFKRTGKAEVILGDFNIPGMMPGMELLYDFGYRNILKETDNRVKGTFRINREVRKRAGRYIPGFTLPERINLDYILLSGNINVLTAYTVETDSSDHLPLVADIELEKVNRPLH